MAFSMGMLRVIAAASAPSANTHFASERTPASFNTVDRGTSTHSDVDNKPCVPCTVFIVGSDHSVSPLPEHSKNMILEMAGKRLRSAIENFLGCFTIPCTNNSCVEGSIVAIPP